MHNPGLLDDDEAVKHTTSTKVDKSKDTKTLKPPTAKPQAKRSFSAGAAQVLARESAEEGFVLVSSDATSSSGIGKRMSSFAPFVDM